MHPQPRRRIPITDSPWYWVYLFATAGLIALVLMGPKFSARQAQLERKAQGRQRAAQAVHGTEPSTSPLASAKTTSINLWPLYVILGALLVLSWARLLTRRRIRESSAIHLRE